mmetsp:Transcript_23448/g.66675  ORF Transcript_23448/g.66675 Transcript_23448/m.66675 type:complete len:172 (-) Transcript_23448:1342-1857(-)
MGESKYADEDVESKFADGGGESKFGESKSKDADDEAVSLMLRATNFCFSAEFIGVFERFIEKHAYIFHDAVRSGSSEHALEFTDLFKDYLELYESTMETWLDREGLTLSEFNQALQEAQNRGKVSEKYFIKLLIASGEYDCFYDVMMREAQRQVQAEDDTFNGYREEGDDM